MKEAQSGPQIGDLSRRARAKAEVILSEGICSDNCACIAKRQILIAQKFAGPATTLFIFLIRVPVLLYFAFFAYVERARGGRLAVAFVLRAISPHFRASAARCEGRSRWLTQKAVSL
jgi:hypothetical protein